MRIAIIGAGKMGSWLAAVLMEGNEIAIYDVVPGKAGAVRGARSLPSLSGLDGFAPELLINAASLQSTVEAFEGAVKHIPKGCIICDVASIKAGLGEFYAGCGFAFASVHPMFGPTFADMESLKEENAVVIKESDGRAKELFMTLFRKLGVRVYEYTFSEHDAMMAYSLTTPFVASLVFAACMDSAAVPGSTFARHRRIAKGLLSEDDHLLSEILFNPHSLPQLEKITGRLEFLKHVIKARDYAEAGRFFGKLRKNVG